MSVKLSRSRVFLPSVLQREGRRLLNQQCWLWGQDIKRKEGNLLQLYGFERKPLPAGVSGSTEYLLELPNGYTVRLWGFGMSFGRNEGVFLNRYEFIPRVASQKLIGDANAMRSLPRAENLAFVAEAAEWLGQYEDWVLQTQGRAFRERCLIGWDSDRIPASAFAACWMSFAQRVFHHRSMCRAGVGTAAKPRQPADPHALVTKVTPTSGWLRDSVRRESIRAEA